MIMKRVTIYRLDGAEIEYCYDDIMVTYEGGFVVLRREIGTETAYPAHEVKRVRIERLATQGA